MSDERLAYIRQLDRRQCSDLLAWEAKDELLREIDRLQERVVELEAENGELRNRAGSPCWPGPNAGDNFDD